ncbi:PREDICTED: polyubiquitin-like isoform X1 [Branchiostoma belcheri]|uniref:Polyubiquitin-like isoform X1 n=1 Tax=Branchiostoma belcheri TaxID=7741 RepID=A0A6P4YXH4_BRABE|nr:PREDICTED: polyubiquitin-like isoform X1 [Branchiostoma belcheri]
MAKRKRNGLDSEEDVVNMSTLRELLDNQKREFTTLMDLQQKNFNSFMETFMVTTNRRLDDIVREVQDVRGSLQCSQKEIGGADTSHLDQDQRITEIESKIVELRADVDCSMLTLFVKGLQGKTHIVRIHKDATVDTLYRKISEKCKIPLKLCRVLLENRCKQLEYGMGKYLSDYNLRDGSTLHIIMRLLGCSGACPKPTSNTMTAS